MKWKNNKNETFTGSSVISGGKIVAGRNVTPIKPIGEVVVSAGARLTIEADEKFIAKEGVRVEIGGKLTANP